MMSRAMILVVLLTLILAITSDARQAKEATRIGEVGFEAVCETMWSDKKVCSHIAQAQILSRVFMASREGNRTVKAGDTVASVEFSRVMSCGGKQKQDCEAATSTGCEWLTFKKKSILAIWAGAEKGMCVLSSGKSLLNFEEKVLGPTVDIYSKFPPTEKLMRTCLMASGLEFPQVVPEGCHCCTVPNIYGIRHNGVTGATQRMALCMPGMFATLREKLNSNQTWCEGLNVDGVKDPLNGVVRSAVPTADASTVSSAVSLRLFNTFILSMLGITTTILFI